MNKYIEFCIKVVLLTVLCAISYLTMSKMILLGEPMTIPQMLGIIWWFFASIATGLGGIVMAISIFMLLHV